MILSATVLSPDKRPYCFAAVSARNPVSDGEQLHTSLDQCRTAERTYRVGRAGQQTIQTRCEPRLDDVDAVLRLTGERFAIDGNAVGILATNGRSSTPAEYVLADASQTPEPESIGQIVVGQRPASGTGSNG